MQPKKVILWIIIVAAVAVVAYAFMRAPVKEPSPVSQESPVEQQARSAIEKALAEGVIKNPYERVPEGTRLLSIDITENTVSLDFSKEILSKGRPVFEDTFSLVSNTVHPFIESRNGEPIYDVIHLKVLVEGGPIPDTF